MEELEAWRERRRCKLISCDNKGWTDKSNYNIKNAYVLKSWISSETFFHDYVIFFSHI